VRYTKLFLTSVLCLCLALPVSAAGGPLGSVYLPLISSGSSVTPRLDLAHLPPCDYAALAKLDPNTLPDYTSTTGCMSKSVQMGFPDHEQANVNAAAPSDLFVPSVIAQHVLVCSSCTSVNGIVQIQANISSQKVIIPQNLWHYYFWGNMMGLRDTRAPITCQNGYGTFPTLRVGIGLGRATNDMVLTDRRIYWEVMAQGWCYAFTDPYNPSFAITGNASPKFELYKTGPSGSNSIWAARVWLGTWVVLFSNVTMPINGSANGVFAGQWVSAVNSDFASVTEYSNFVHKIEIVPMDIYQYRSWYAAILPVRLVNVTSYAPAPFNVMDLVTGDWTSFSSNINQ